MSTSLLFWIIMLLWLIFGLYRDRALGPWNLGGHVILWVLLAILGWKVFGPAIHQ